MQPLGIGIDTGGTFTDIVLFDLRRQTLLRKAKTPTTHGDYTVCIGAAFAALALSAQEVPALTRVALSTTLATNTVAEGRVHPSALVLEPADVRVPPGFHPHLAVLKSCLGFNTEEVVAVSEREVLAHTAPLAPLVESFAVSGYAATRNPDHERRIAHLLRQAYGKPVVLGSELTHRLNFLERAQAAALNAGLLPVILEWLQAVRAILARQGIACPLYIVKGDGSLMEQAEAERRPVQTLFSGPAASLHGGTFLSGQAHAVVVDVGGTTTDLGWVRGGRGQLKQGGIRINDRQIAVDGLDMATFGLAGDSRLAQVGERRLRFLNQRCLPFCRAAERLGPVPWEQLEAELAGQWHFGDPELLELAALDPLQGTAAAGPAQPGQALLLERLRGGPSRVQALAAAHREAGLPESQFPGDFQELLRRRRALRVALTPTDVFCAQGLAPRFSQADARQAVAAYARMLDCPPEEFLAQLMAAVREQATAILAGFLLGFDPPQPPEGPVLETLVRLLYAQGAAGPHLALDPVHPVVLVGAGAPVLYHQAPPSLRRRMLSPADGDVANALGAITSRFLLRESVSIEPVRRGGVELFDHQGRRFFPTLAEAVALARRELEAALRGQAQALGLTDVALDVQEEVLEEYPEFGHRARKELVIARVHALLTGLPD